MPDSVSERWPQRGQWFHLFHTITLASTFLTNNLAIVVTPLFWRGAGGEATLRFAELVIGSIKASAKNPEQKNYSSYFHGHF